MDLLLGTALLLGGIGFASIYERMQRAERAARLYKPAYDREWGLELKIDGLESKIIELQDEIELLETELENLRG